MPDQHPKDYYMRRLGELDKEFSSFRSHYKDLSDFIRPRRGRFLVTDRNKGNKRHNSIINSRATQALRNATSGMLAGTMSPSRPWFALETIDRELMERAEVKEWLFKVELLLRRIFNESNFYGMASNFLSELLMFGTAAMTHIEDFDDVARFYTHTAGAYRIAQNERFEIDTIFREFEWTAEMIVRAFGLENVSRHVKDAVDRNNLGAWFPVVHVIEPNDNMRVDTPLAQNKPFKSVYFEKGTDGLDDRDSFLRISGFDEFPAYVARWDVTGEDIYGTDCPGMTALGDIKGLQIEERRKAQGIDKMVNPPLHGPSSVRNSTVNSISGGLTIYDTAVGENKLEPLYNVNLPLQELRLDIDAVERRIDQAFFVDLFLAISQIEGIQPRNELDLLQRNEERLLMLGPVLERLQNEFLDKLIDRTFNQASRAGILPQIPDTLQGAPLRVKYISTLAMAQRAVATQSIDRLVAVAGNMASAGWPDALKKVNAVQTIDEYAKAIGTPPTVIRSDEDVAQAIQEEQEAIQAQQALEQAQAGANVAKMASDSKLEDDNALSRAIG